MEKIPDNVAEQLLHEVDEFLYEHGVLSAEELRSLLAKIDTALAINNNPKAREMRRDLIERYGADAKK